MFERLPLRLRSADHALRGGFLVRPLVIALVLGLCGAVLSSHAYSQMAQTILGVIAKSIVSGALRPWCIIWSEYAVLA